ncbi:MAG: hypothetical protein JNJ54_04265 [Myxococcaceae bacterium]|nr:hypothetical protein [Myxococcaceae bacterium]
MSLQLIPGLRVHDATVLRVMLCQPECLLEFERVDGSKVGLVLNGCSAFGVVGLRERAIVLSVEAYHLRDDKPPPTDEHWRTLVGGDYQPGAHEFDRYRSANDYLVSVNNSFGGALVILCRSFVVEERPRC